MEEEGYVCTLSEQTLKKACQELNEDPRERIGAIAALRKWIHEQPHLKANTNTKVLLRYLRGAKFSQLRAREILENHLRGKILAPEYTVDLRVDDKIMEFLRTGYIFPLPKRDREGKVIVIFRAGAFDPIAHDKSVIMSSTMAVANWLLQNEETQVNGILYFIDLTGFTMKHQTFWTLDDMRRMSKIWQKGVPARFKGFHYYNLNPFFEVFFQMMVPLMSKKFRDRIFLHGSNMESVYKHIPMDLLPVEYLPDDYGGPNAGSVKDIIDNLVNNLKDPAFQKVLAEETDSRYHIDESRKPSAAEVPAASFRKLNID